MSTVSSLLLQQQHALEERWKNKAKHRLNTVFNQQGFGGECYMDGWFWSLDSSFL